MLCVETMGHTALTTTKTLMELKDQEVEKEKHRVPARPKTKRKKQNKRKNPAIGLRRAYQHVEVEKSFYGLIVNVCVCVWSKKLLPEHRVKNT